MTFELRLFGRSSDQHACHPSMRAPVCLGLDVGCRIDRQAQPGPPLRDHLPEFFNPQPIPRCARPVKVPTRGGTAPMSKLTVGPTPGPTGMQLSLRDSPPF